jgi:hypothetical protein
LTVVVRSVAPPIIVLQLLLDLRGDQATQQVLRVALAELIGVVAALDRVGHVDINDAVITKGSVLETWLMVRESPHRKITYSLLRDNGSLTIRITQKVGSELKTVSEKPQIHEIETHIIDDGFEQIGTDLTLLPLIILVLEVDSKKEEVEFAQSGSFRINLPISCAFSPILRPSYARD